MGNRAAHQNRVKHTRQDEIGDELPLARQQPAVFAPQQRPMSLWRRRSCRILHEGGKIRVRVADDFKAIRLRLEELRRESAQLHADGPVHRPSLPDPDAVALTGRGPERTRNRFRPHCGTDVRGRGN
jgi:hypothetical protein